MYWPVVCWVHWHYSAILGLHYQAIDQKQISYDIFCDKHTWYSYVCAGHLSVLSTYHAVLLLADNLNLKFKWFYVVHVNSLLSSNSGIVSGCPNNSSLNASFR